MGPHRLFTQLFDIQQDRITKGSTRSTQNYDTYTGKLRVLLIVARTHLGGEK